MHMHVHSYVWMANLLIHILSKMHFQTWRGFPNSIFVIHKYHTILKMNIVKKLIVTEEEKSLDWIVIFDYHFEL